MSKQDEKERHIQRLGRIASVLSVLMYVSYIPQIMNNLQGAKGNPIQPFVAMVNCTCWVIYGFMKKNRDWPLVIANVPGIFLGAITFFTAL
ncbi:SemiSWEET family transporter [Enterococcus sp. CSURQ0835]|uniref:SemiSWEET family transporter n=1 Tax=Enterococcus sp. CSURQ0835 TaxID=2681394 RepID=UPI001359FE04|nr:SemiSWEET family transporter [Enterococcus sp. CSURQ0835]